jgi:hypothetical protein
LPKRLADTSAVVRIHQRFIAVLVLLSWIFAIGHVLLEHHGLPQGHAHHAAHEWTGECPGHDDHQDGADDHRDLTAAAARFSLGHPSQQALTAILLSTPLLHLAIGAADVTQAAAAVHVDRRGSPPDFRATGWLLLARTALPVRGPSLHV